VAAAGRAKCRFDPDPVVNSKCSAASSPSSGVRCRTGRAAAPP